MLGGKHWQLVAGSRDGAVIGVAASVQAPTPKVLVSQWYELQAEKT